MALNRSPIVRPALPPPLPRPVVKPVKPAVAPAIKPANAVNNRAAEFSAAGLAAKTTLFKKFDAANGLPTGAPLQSLAAQSKPPFPPVAAPPGIGALGPGQLNLAESKGVSGAAYEAQKVGEVYKLGDGSLWRVDKIQDNQGVLDSGFKAVAMRRVVQEGSVFKDDPTDNRVAVGFAGTDGLSDIDDDLDQGSGRLVPQQYQQGLAFANEVRNEAAQRGENVTLTGHSLGGGIASYVSVNTGIPATAINSAPLAKNHIPEKASSYANQITQYHNNSEFLTKIDNANPLDARPGRDAVVNEAVPPEKANWFNAPIVNTKNALLSFSNHKLGNTATDIREASRYY